jgi:hypothetical protein
MSTLLIGTEALSEATSHEAVAGEIEASQFVAPKGGVLEELVFKPNRAQGASPGTSLVLGIYADSGGSPSGAPLGEGTFAGKIVNGEMKVTGLKISLTAGLTYWLVAMPLGGNLLLHAGNTALHTFSSTAGHTKLESVTWTGVIATGPLTISGLGSLLPFGELNAIDPLTSNVAGYYEKGPWSKMAWAAQALVANGSGVTFPGFGTTAGSFYNAKELPAGLAVAYKRSLGGDIAERFWSLWLCYNDTTHSGYRAKFVDQTTVSECKVVIYKVEAGVEKELGTSAAFTLAIGDQFMWAKNGTKLEAWIRHGGTGEWVNVATFTDSGAAYTGGFIGIDGSGADPNFTLLESTVVPPPEVTNPGTQRNPLNSLLTLKPTTAHATTFSATGLPPGLTVNTATGAITGSPTATGTYTVHFTAEGAGGKATVEWEWVIALPPVAPPGSLREQFPLRLLIGGSDYTPLLADNFTFSTVDPGGFEMASFSLPMDLPQITRNMNVRLDCGLKVAWEGRVKEVDRTLGVKTLIQCEGYGAKLKKETLQEIYVDRDLNNWGGLSVAQELEFLKANSTHFNPRLLYSGSVPTLCTEITDAWISPYKPSGDTIYLNPKRIPVGSVYFRWEIGSAQVNPADASWTWQVIVWENDEPFSGKNESTANLRAAGPEEKLLTVTAGLYYPVLLFFYTTTPAGAAGQRYNIMWSKLAVYGRHGLQKRGAEPGGFYASDIARHAISKAPRFQLGVMPDATNYVVPHAIYLEPVPIEQVISDMAKFAGVHWGVWEPLEPLTGSQLPRLDFRPYPQLGQPTAYALRAECEDVDVREDLENLYDKALVSYSEAAGLTRTVEVSLDNPQLDAINLHQTISLNMGVGTQASAEGYGKIVLALLQDQARVTGTAQIAQPIHSLTGDPKAPWMLRAGLDRLAIPDLPASDVWGEYNDLPISRVECSATDTGISTTVSFGRGPNLVEELTAQLERATEVAAVQ